MTELDERWGESPKIAQEFLRDYYLTRESIARCKKAR